MLESVNLTKTCSKPHESLLLLWPKLPTYFDDVKAIENNRQVRVNIYATLLAIFRIPKWIYVMNSADFFQYRSIRNRWFAAVAIQSEEVLNRMSLLTFFYSTMDPSVCRFGRKTITIVANMNEWVTVHKTGSREFGSQWSLWLYIFY